MTWSAKLSKLVRRMASQPMSLNLVGDDATVRRRECIALLVPQSTDMSANLAVEGAFAWAERALSQCRSVWLLIPSERASATSILDDLTTFVLPVPQEVARSWKWGTARRFPSELRHSKHIFDKIRSVWPSVTVHVIAASCHGQNTILPLVRSETAIVCVDGNLARIGTTYGTWFDDLGDDRRVCEYERRIHQIDMALLQSVQSVDLQQFERLRSEHANVLPSLCAMYLLVRSLAATQQTSWCGRVVAYSTSPSALDQVLERQDAVALNVDQTGDLSLLSTSALVMWPCRQQAVKEGEWDAWLDRRLDRVASAVQPGYSLLGPDIDDGLYVWDRIELASHVRNTVQWGMECGSRPPTLLPPSVWTRRHDGVLVQVFDTSGALRAQAQRLSDPNKTTAQLAYEAALDLQNDATYARNQPLSVEEVRSGALVFRVDLLEPVETRCILDFP